MKFRIKAGKFTDKKIDEKGHKRRGKTYKKGQIVTSDVDLTQVFRNVFERVHEDEEVTPSGEVGGPAQIPEPVKAVKGGKKSAPTPKPDKYAVSAPPAAPKPPKSGETELPRIPMPGRKSTKKSKYAGNVPKPVTSKLGIDVSDRFPGTENGDVRIFRKGRKYFAVESDDPDTSITKAPMTLLEATEFVASIQEKSEPVKTSEPVEPTKSAEPVKNTPPDEKKKVTRKKTIKRKTK